MSSSLATLSEQISRAEAEQQIMDLLQRYPDLLDTLLANAGHQSASSFMQKQLHQLREKLHESQHQREQLLSVATQNQALFTSYAKLNQRLLACANMRDVIDALSEIMIDGLGLAELRYVGLSELPLGELAALNQLMDKRISDDKFYFGRLTSDESSRLGLADQGSVSLMAIGETETIAVLAVRSNNPSHFYPQMDTLLLSQLQQLLSVVVGKL